MPHWHPGPYPGTTRLSAAGCDPPRSVPSQAEHCSHASPLQPEPGAPGEVKPIYQPKSRWGFPTHSRHQPVDLTLLGHHNPVVSSHTSSPPLGQGSLWLHWWCRDPGPCSSQKQNQSWEMKVDPFRGRTRHAFPRGASNKPWEWLQRAAASPALQSQAGEGAEVTGRFWGAFPEQSSGTGWFALARSTDELWATSTSRPGLSSGRRGPSVSPVPKQLNILPSKGWWVE